MWKWIGAVLALITGILIRCFIEALWFHDRPDMVGFAITACFTGVLAIVCTLAED